jgi:hypothetical protein
MGLRRLFREAHEQMNDRQVCHTRQHPQNGSTGAKAEGIGMDLQPGTPPGLRERLAGAVALRRQPPGQTASPALNGAGPSGGARLPGTTGLSSLAVAHRPD